MDPGLVTSLSGALAQARQVDKISNNLANADTPGYKGDELAFEEMLTSQIRQDSRAGIPERAATDRELFSRQGDEVRPTLHGEEFVRWQAGGIRQTGNPLDFAIEGNGFFEVLSPVGVKLTRAGHFAIDAQGRLVNPEGFPVLAAGAGAPETRTLRVGTSHLNADIEGNLYDLREQQVMVGRLSVVSVENPTALKKIGHGLFEAGPEAFVKGPRGPASELTNPLDPQASTPRANPLGSASVAPRIHQGMIEGSNVNPVKEMTRLIQAHRLFDQNIKLMEKAGEFQQMSADLGKF